MLADCPRQPVTACLIVRNEAGFVAGCLESVSQFVSEIVIVDTGSTDDTLEICKKFDVKLFHHPWVGDFSAARNVGLEKATCDWILYIDADERLSVPPNSIVGEQLRQPNNISLEVLFRPRVEFTPYREVRLFRRMDAIRFQGRIHETVHPHIRSLVDTGKFDVLDCDVEIQHLGYEGDLAHKHERNLPLLQQAVKENPARVYLWCNLGETLLAVNQPQAAVVALKEAIRLSRLSIRGQKQHADGAQAAILLIHHLLESDAEAALDLCQENRKGHPNNKALELLEATARFKLGEAESLLATLDGLIGIDAHTFVDPLTSYDKRIFGSWAHNLRGDVFVRLGQHDRAVEDYRSANLLEPGVAEYAIKQAAFSAASNG